MPYLHGSDRHFLKFLSFLMLIVLIPTLGLLGFLLQRTISPILFIRVGILPSQYLGHFLYEVDLYLADEDDYAGIRKIDLITFQPIVSNKYLEDKIRLALKIRNPILVYPIYLVNRLLSPNSRYLKRFAKDFKLNDSARLASLPPNKIAREIISETHNELTELYIEKSIKNLFVFFLRTKSFPYLRKGVLDSKSSIYRDVSSSDYDQLMFSLNVFGKSFVLGHDTPLAKELNLKIVEVEKINFGLCSKSKVSITTDSGSALIPFFLRKPIVQTNISMFGLIYGIPSKLILPKMYLDLESGIKLTFRECLRQGIHNVTNDLEFSKKKIKVLSLDEYTLRDLAQEIIEISNQAWEPSALNLKVTDEFRSEFLQLYPLLQFQTFPNFWVEKNLWFFA